MSGIFEVLNPWAETDPMPLSGISPRLTNISRKKIGLFSNSKRASKPLLAVIEKRLKERYPDCTTSWYEPFETYNMPYWVVQVESEKRAIFQEWVNGVDAIIHATGD
jgi:hypothetical protein